MNGALLSSKNMGWCTPADFFSELDQEFHFNLDPAATDKCAMCTRGVACSVIHPMAARSMNG